MNNHSGSHAVFMQLVPLSRAPGNIVDWMYKKMGVKYSFAAHLRDTGTVSFSFESQIFRQNPLAQSVCSMVLLCQNNGYDRLAKKPQG